MARVNIGILSAIQQGSGNISVTYNKITNHTLYYGSYDGTSSGTKKWVELVGTVQLRSPYNSLIQLAYFNNNKPVLVGNISWLGYNYNYDTNWRTDSLRPIVNVFDFDSSGHVITIDYMLGSNNIPIYELTEGSNYNLTISKGQNIKNVVYNGTTITTFPSVQSVSANTSLTVNGLDTPQLTLLDGQNMKSVIDGATIYNNLPVTIDIPTNKSLVLNGADDKVITVDYNNTGVPIVTNT